MPEALTPEQFHANAARIEQELAKVIVGQREVVRHVIVALIAGGHVLLEGVPGLGKTVLIRTLGQALNLRFSRIQFTPDLMPADITGTEILIDQDGRRSFQFQPGPVFANLILADEINRATPKTQSALLQAMQEATVTVADRTHTLEPPFFVMATQNPIEMEGTYPLPEAQVDRFFFKVDIPYPSTEELDQILERTTGQQVLEAEACLGKDALLVMQSLARAVPIATHVREYVSRLVVATHPERPEATPLARQFVRYGASPRGGQALILGAKVTALLSGRYNVAFQDVVAIAPAALRHRLILNFDGAAEGITPDQIVAELLELAPGSQR